MSELVPVRPQDEDYDQSRAYRKEGKDVKDEQGQSLVSLLPDYDGPNVGEGQTQEKDVQSNENVVHNCVDHYLFFGQV